ncbi:glycoside hydrolase family 25 protein [Olsenella sp. HMSC062G07]|uniref:glycoside hydrolase family 25 protein n=1 Tax=Olsenella sp. HMSC062G07 TaxID=1739330 RepID=UPI0008BEF650|nr:glycoside hydrolase family 25 protein [Olsenella sp. HMSC062G07]OFK22402.1 hypothetical protein HMPREF2826_01245 [Olsenella sp. HMSC062G07]
MRRRARTPRRRGGLARRALIVAALVIVLVLGLRLTVCGGAATSWNAAETGRLKGKSLGISDVESLNLSPYSWDNVKKVNGRLAYVRDGETLSSFGIDVSEHNGDIDWKKVREAGVEFAYIRVGYRGSIAGNIVEDARFARNMAEARSAGVKVGVYFFSQAKTEGEAREEADFATSKLGGADVDYPVAFDMEPDAAGSDRVSTLSGQELTTAARSFCDQCEKNGYHAVVYGNQYDLSQYDQAELARHGFWYAEYGTTPTSRLRFRLWQYTKTGTIPGIDGKVDLDLDLSGALDAEDAQR